MSAELIPNLTDDDMTPEQARGKIMALEAAILAMPEQLIEIETTHYFAPGVYMRQVRIPKGTVLTGLIHKTEHMNILSLGELTVWTEDGMKRIRASTVIKSQPGIKRAAYAHEESVWITVHPNIENETDVTKLEKLLVVKTFQELSQFMDQKQIQEGLTCPL